MRRSIRPAIFIATVSLLSGTWAERAAAVSGASFVSGTKGISLHISTQWVDGTGYRPVEVSVVPASPLAVAADQTLHIELHFRQNYYNAQREVAASQDIELPAGSTGVFQTIAVPQQFVFQTNEVDVWLNGRYSKALSQPLRAAPGAGVVFEGLPNVLLVSPAVAPAPASPFATPDPISAPLNAVFPAEFGQQQYSNMAMAAGRLTAPSPAGIPLPTMMTLHYGRLPQRWIEYSSLDLVCLARGTLEQLAAHEPRRCEALRQWLASGGNVIVFDLGPGGAHADDAARLLAPGGSLASGLVADRWQKPSADDRANRLKSYGGVQPPIIGDAPMQAPDPPPFALRRIGSGMLLAADVDDLFAQSPQDWIWMLNAIGSDRWLWYRRHGLSLDRKNADFWNWLVRGVGMAPVTEFRVLITLFVLAIGPLNYFWLRRRGRLYLLVIVVPFAACVVTFGLFGYAILADGLDVRVRARTLTQLDQRTGQAVCWSRISYYAGLAPSGGLVLPDDVVVLPLTANDDEASDMPRRQNVIWSPHEQALVSGWLPSRTPMQFITVRSRASQAALRVLPARGGADLHVANQLGTRVLRLLLSDDEGRHYRAANIAAGATVALAAVDDPGEEEAAIFELASELQPSVPEGFVPPSSYGYGSRRRYRYWAAASNSLAAPTLMSGRLEAELREALVGPGKLVSASKPNRFPLGNRRYLAVVERSPEVVYGVANPREEDSLHVVVGSW